MSDKISHDESEDSDESDEYEEDGQQQKWKRRRKRKRYPSSSEYESDESEGPDVISTSEDEQTVMAATNYINKGKPNSFLFI